MRKKEFSVINKKERKSWLLFIAVFITYSIVSMARNGYAASIAAVTEEGIFNKSQSGIINASFYFFYGISQLLGVKFLDKVSPIKFITISFLGTIISCVGMAMSNSFGALLFFWSFCGLSQFAIWPSVVRVIAEYLLPEHKNRAMLYIAFAYCVGAIMNYIVAALVLNVARWTVIFWIYTIVLTIVVCLWVFLTNGVVPSEKEFERNKKEHQTKEEKPTYNYKKLLISSGTIFLLFTAFLRSAVDAGLKAWIPTMIIESYQGISTSFASVLTTCLIVINLLGVFYASGIYPKKTKSIVKGYSSCFLISIPFVAMLLLTGKIPVFLVVVLLTIITTMMYAGHQFINVFTPSYFVRYNRAGSVAATINAIASFGAVAGSFSYGYIAEKSGWTAVIILCTIIMFLAFIFCMCALPLWEKFTEKE